MLLIDGHLDLSWNALTWNRDLDLPVTQIREAEAGIEGKGRGANVVSFPAMRQGQIGIAFATLLARCSPTGRSILDFKTQELACATALGQWNWYKLLENRGVCRFVTGVPSLREAVAAWQSPACNTPFGFVVSMEGADPILSPSHAAKWFNLGLRTLGLAHYGPSAYAHGTGSEGPLKVAGHDLLRAMEELGLILDMTHLADESFWDAARRFHGSVLASHNNCRALVPGQRQFSDDQLRFLIERGGVIGTAFDAWMLIPNWKGEKRSEVTLQSAVDQIDHVCQLAGNAKHVGIGSDLDGGFGVEQCPSDLDTISDLQNLAPLLQDRGYSEFDITAVFHANWLRFFEAAWPGNSQSAD